MNFLYSTKQTQDDEKSVERAHRELVKLDQQMNVSVAQFTEVSQISKINILLLIIALMNRVCTPIPFQLEQG